MITFHHGKVVFLLGLAILAPLAEPVPQEDRSENKKAESKKNSTAPAAAPVVVDYKISVEGMTSIPRESKVEVEGLNNCEASATARINTGGQGTFKSIPPCIAELKISITGLNTRIAQIDVAKYKGAPVKIEIILSSKLPNVTFPDLTPPAVPPAK
ncbi:MAG: hypothetical protein ABI833_19645 [Acidobacteriota bacterium]